MKARVADAQRGQAAVLLIGVLTLAVAFVGVAVDGARLFTARRDLSSIADAAALAGASAIDLDLYRASLGRQLSIDRDRAREVVASVVAGARLPAGTALDVTVEGNGVEVRLARPVSTTFLRIVGLGEQQIGAHARAAPRRN